MSDIRSRDEIVKEFMEDAKLNQKDMEIEIMTKLRDNEANFLIPENIRLELCQLHSSEELHDYFKSKKSQIVKRPRCSCHYFVDYFLIHSVSDEGIDLTRFVVCYDCLRTNLKHNLHIQLTFGNKWAISINEQDEALILTDYGKQVLNRAINKEQYEMEITKAINSDLRIENCYPRNEYSWAYKHGLYPMMLDPWCAEFEERAEATGAFGMKERIEYEKAQGTWNKFYHHP